MSLDLWAAFALGLVGSGHCLVMCGPLALALPRRGRQGFALHLSRLVYNLGRTATYATLGLLFGALGQTVAIAGLQRALSIGLGITLLGLAIVRGHRGGQPPRWMSRLFFVVQSKLGKQLRASQDAENRSATLALGPPFAFGFLNGLLPCGLVWAALAAATALGSATQGAV
ncbi:MAG: sulfite exporter TauE/SafE family protein, partial [Thermoanaerobaculia bacterium]|nr:sulfite exporter TauE/SafE family protein [Thermoanaerobaculia bacterium]